MKSQEKSKEAESPVTRSSQPKKKNGICNGKVKKIKLN